jgi:hypothetical protein
MNNDTFKASITFVAMTEGLMYKVRFILAFKCLVGGNIFSGLKRGEVRGVYLSSCYA